MYDKTKESQSYQVKKVISDEYMTDNDPMAQFLDEILPRCYWDLLPLEFIYYLYGLWIGQNNPSAKLLGKKGFAQELDEQVVRFPDLSYVRDRIDKPSDSMMQFLDEILPQLVWDLVPLDFIFTLYRVWMRRNYPLDRTHNMNTFAKKLSERIKLFPEWSYDRNKIHSVGHLMDRYEPLIDEYDLNSVYGTGARRRSSYRGLLRVDIQSGTADDK